METCTLVQDGEKYGGQYVATRSFQDKEVISFGTDPLKVFEEAKRRGIEDPVIFYVPRKDMVHIY